MPRVMVVLVSLALLVSACNASISETAPEPTPTDATESTPSTGQQPKDVEGIQVRYGTITERTIDPAADGANTTAAIKGINEFSVDLYKAIAGHESGNLIISPYSVAFALSMVLAGANGETATEMEDVLAMSLPGADWHEGINAYDLSLDARTTGSTTDWASANKVWAQPGLELRNEFLDILTGAYGSPLAEADFTTDVDAQRRAINDWIANNTNDLIPELFPAGSLDPATVMVLVNAIALDAPWEFPFDPDHTSDQPFTRVDGSIVTVPTMHYDEFLPSARTESYQAVEIPYGDGALSMVVIVPNDLEEFEANLTASELQEVIDGIRDGGIHLSIPKWTARTHLTLNQTLIELGMPSAFNPTSADFSKMVAGGGIWLDRVEHEAFIEVDEAGTRAAAATGAAMAASHGPTVTVDKPYLYLIRDRGAGTILFMGRVLDPTG